MNPNEPSPAATPKFDIGTGTKILLFLIAPVILAVSLFITAGAVVFIAMLWQLITCPQCPFYAI